MAKQEFEAERLLKRLKSLDWTSPQRDRAKAEGALKALYAAVQHPFPGFRWVPRLQQDTLLEPMRAAWSRYCAEGAPRVPDYPFQRLYDAVLATRPTLAFLQGPWFKLLQRNDFRCGSEPREFVNKISAAGDRASRAAIKALNSEKFQDLQESALRKAAKTVVNDAGALIPSPERKDATDALVNGLRNAAILPNHVRVIPRQVGEWAEWRARHGAEGEAGLPDQMTPMLHLIDAVDAGLWFFWPGTEAVIAVARPKLSN
jgi:hypothetical protein